MVWILTTCTPGVQPPAYVATPEPLSERCPVGPQLESTDVVSSDDRPIVVLLPGPVNPAHAPVPLTPAERILFPQLYETLVRVTCTGRVEGELAESWSVSADSLEWTFTVRADARDWNGDGVTATTVGQSWTDGVALTAGRPLAVLFGPRLVGIDALSSHILRVRTSEPVPLSWFARTDLAVARASEASSTWPVGSGPVRPVDFASPLAPSMSGAGSDGALSRVLLQGTTSLEARAFTSDARSALESGTDVLVTSDPEVIDYAEAAPGFATLPLGWDRSYLLLTPVGAPVAAAMGPPTPGSDTTLYPMVRRPPESALIALARDAVPIEARPKADEIPPTSQCAAQPSWWAPRPPDYPPTLQAPVRNILYPVDDPVARSLAERLTALAMSSQAGDRWITEMVPGLTVTRLQGRPTAGGLALDEFGRALAGGRYPSYVVPMERAVTGAGCGLLAHLLGLAPWLAAEPSTSDAAPSILPLVDTRSTLVLRRGIVGATVDGNGVVQLGGVRRVAPE